MSKPYPLLKEAGRPQKLTIVPLELTGKDTFVADISGQINFEWLTFWENNDSSASLNYCIFSEDYFTPAHLPLDSKLANAFKAQLPPGIPGIYVIDLVPGRIRVYLAYGNIFKNLSSYLLHPSQSIHQDLQGFQFDAWVIGDMLPSAEVNALIMGMELPRPTQKKLKNAPWCFGQSIPNKRQKTIIIGAGLAGTCLARTLAEGGREVLILEKENSIALQGSGNRYSVLYPKLALYDAPFTNLLLQSYPFAFQYYQKYIYQNHALGQAYPLYQTLKDNILEMQGLIEASPHWFSLEEDKLRFHHALVMDMPALCQELILHPNIEVRCSEEVVDFTHDEKGFQVNGYLADELVICNGFSACQFKETAFLGIKGMRGQMTHISPVHQEEKIYCNEGHFLPLRDGLHALGASFNPYDLSLAESAIDHEKNLKPWVGVFGENKTLDIISSWVGIRGVSGDHLPIVGFVPNQEKFLESYRLWQHHANLNMNTLMPNIPGLYVFSGFGARGLLNIPYLAHVLKALMSKEQFLMPVTLSQALSPARFLKKKLTVKHQV